MLAAPKIGQVLGQYRLLEQIGAGGMGVVYRARDLQLERDVAVKVLPAGALADEAGRVRFRQEALSLAKLNHPNIATIFQFGSENGLDFLVTEYIPGATLEDKLHAGPLPQSDLVSLGIQLANGLACAHQEGVIHRDLKPGNLRITPDGRLKILDFGLARLMEQHGDLAKTASLTQSQEVTGTLPYMAPEQLRGESTDERSDIWSAGAVLYEMATGQRPYPEKQSAKLIDAILNKPPQDPTALNARLSPGLARVILKALDKRPEQRYQSARELGADLDRLSIGVQPLAAKRRWRAVAAMVAAALLIAAVIGGVVWRTQAHRLTEKDTVVLTDFGNSTGDPIFDGTLKKALAVDLGQSPYLNVFPEQRVRQTLNYMGKPAEQRITQEVAREICQREGLKATINGSIASLGSQYVITLDASNASTGDTLAETQAQAGSKEQVLAALGKAATGLREKLGESLSSVQKYDKPLPEATTSSLEALKVFSLGDAKHFAGEELQAVPLYKRAVELDPQFALAYARLAAIYGNMGELQSAQESNAKAFELRNRASERERLYITAHYYSDGGDLEKGIDAYELYKQSYPRDSIPYNNLAVIYFNLGQFERALENAQQALKIDSTSASNHENVAVALMALNRLPEARKVLNETVQQNLGASSAHVHLAQIDLAEGDLAGMQKEEALAGSTPQGQAWALGVRIRWTVTSGQLRKAQELAGDFGSLVDRAGFSQARADMMAFLAAFYGFYGYPPRAQQEAKAALEVSRSTEILANVAVALAVSGESGRAQELIDEATQRRPNDMVLTRLRLPTAKAWVLMQRGEAANAVQVMEPAKPYDDGDASALLTRGWAYLESGQTQPAIQEFQKALRLASSMPEDPTMVLAHLGLARAYVNAGEKEKVRKEYDGLLHTWKDADPGLPKVAEVKREREKLER
jgi:eukaryotic-like serine/threonine-protein kinase